MFLKIIFLLLIAPSLFANSLKIVALGDSVTVGYGVAKQDAYPAVLQKKLQKKYPGLQVINAGSSGSTTASAISSLKWQLKHPFQILILCLGGNDGLRGLKLESSEKNISKVIAMSQANGIKVLLVGMRIPKIMG